MITNGHKNIKLFDFRCGEKLFKNIFDRCGIIEYTRNIYRYVLSAKKSLEKCVE